MERPGGRWRVCREGMPADAALQPFALATVLVKIMEGLRLYRRANRHVVAWFIGGDGRDACAPAAAAKEHRAFVRY